MRRDGSFPCHRFKCKLLCFRHPRAIDAVFFFERMDLVVDFPKVFFDHVDVFSPSVVLFLGKIGSVTSFAFVRENVLCSLVFNPNAHFFLRIRLSFV